MTRTVGVDIETIKQGDGSKPSKGTRYLDAVLILQERGVVSVLDTQHVFHQTAHRGVMSCADAYHHARHEYTC